MSSRCNTKLPYLLHTFAEGTNRYAVAQVKAMATKTSKEPIPLTRKLPLGLVGASVGMVSVGGSVGGTGASIMSNGRNKLTGTSTVG